MKIDKFIESHKIKPSLAAGFRAHMHRFGDAKLDDKQVIAEFEKFAGIKPDGSSVQPKPVHRKPTSTPPPQTPTGDTQTGPDANAVSGDDSESSRSKKNSRGK